MSERLKRLKCTDNTQLVNQLYAPNNPQAIKDLESQLRELQKSSHGWEIADHLLASSDLNVRFFGALTFQIKINTGRRVFIH
jgi:hypothetical protein